RRDPGRAPGGGGRDQAGGLPPGPAGVGAAAFGVGGCNTIAIQLQYNCNTDEEGTDLPPQRGHPGGTSGDCGGLGRIRDRGRGPEHPPLPPGPEGGG
ncbi:hypothetical protein ABTD17_17960, partial [Acinetobacter baumannii]